MNELIEEFWRDLKFCKSKQSYKDLLAKVEIVCLKELKSKEGENSISEGLPMLAMISEVQLLCPAAVNEMAQTNAVFSTANNLLSGYSQEDRNFLRSHFLKGIENDNVIYMDFINKKTKSKP